MANVVSVIRRPGRKGAKNVSDTGIITQEEHAIWQVTFDATDWTIAQAFDASATVDGVTTAIPPILSLLSGYLLLLLTNKDGIELKESPLVCIVDCLYTIPPAGKNDPPDYDSGKWNINITSAGLPYEEEINAYKDPASGTYKVIKASSKEVLQPLAKKTFQRERIVVEWDTNLPDWDTYSGCRGKTNQDELTMTIGAPRPWNNSYHYKVGDYVGTSEFDDLLRRKKVYICIAPNVGQSPPNLDYWLLSPWGSKRTFPINTLKCDDVQSRTVIDANGNVATHVSAVLIYDEETWDWSPIDAGWEELDPDGNPRRIKEGVGSAVATNSAQYQAASPRATISYLDGSGHQLADGLPAVALGPFPLGEQSVDLTILLESI